MKRKFTLFCLAFLQYSITHCQTTEPEKSLKEQKKDTIVGWTRSALIGLNLTQTSLTNWAAGGQNSLAGNGLLSLTGTYKSGRGMWENTLDIGYGGIKQGKNAPWWKTDDKIDFTSKYGRNLAGNWYLAALINFKTQLVPGFNYPNDTIKISDFLAPGYLIAGLGMNYAPDTNFTIFIAPLTGKVTLINDQKLADAGAFGVTPGEKIRTEFGSYIRFLYRKSIMENILFLSKLDMFSNYLNNPENIDINWEVLLGMKINKFFSATVSTQLIYDNDIDIAVDTNDDGVKDKAGPRTQFKEILAVGFSYQF